MLFHMKICDDDLCEGCPWDGEAALFLQYEEEDEPILKWSWRFLSDYQLVENVVGWPSYKWMPDGHLSTLRVGQTSIQCDDQLLLTS